MPRTKLDRETRRSILDARAMIQASEKADCNEAETRRRIERIFETLMGYDPFKHLSRERAVRGAGETEHVDFAIELGEGDEAKPVVMVEIKRVNVDLGRKHLRQVSSYAINAGCEWILLTNSKEWRLYHVAFGQPPVTKHIFSWNIVTDDPAVLAERFALISLKSLRRGALDKLWEKTNVLLPRNLLQAILSEKALTAIRRKVARDSGVRVSPEDIVAGIRRLLNEPAQAELADMRISLPAKKTRARRTTKGKEKPPSSVSQQDPTEVPQPTSAESPRTEPESAAPPAPLPPQQERTEPSAGSV